MCDGSQRTVKDPTAVQSFYMGGHSNLAEAPIARTPKLLHLVIGDRRALCIDLRFTQTFHGDLECV